MKVVIVFNHPYEGSFCNAVLGAVTKGLKASNHEVDLIHLDKDCFNPVMQAEDLLAFKNKRAVDYDALSYIQRLSQADHLVFIFPIWWELMPASMKGFIDKVIFPGAFYEYSENGYGMKRLMTNINKVTVITTMNTPAFIYKVFFGNAIKSALVKGTLKKTGYKKVKWISYNMVKSSTDKKRAKWLSQLEKRFASIR